MISVVPPHLALRTYCLRRHVPARFARQMRRQFLSPGMLALVARLGRLQYRLAPAFGFHFLAADARLELQQLQLRVAELLARRAVLLDPLQPQLLFQGLNLQVGPLEFAFERNDFGGVGSGGKGGLDAHNGIRQLSTITFYCPALFCGISDSVSAETSLRNHARRLLPARSMPPSNRANSSGLRLTLVSPPSAAGHQKRPFSNRL